MYHCRLGTDEGYVPANGVAERSAAELSSGTAATVTEAVPGSSGGDLEAEAGAEVQLVEEYSFMDFDSDAVSVLVRLGDSIGTFFGFYKQGVWCGTRGRVYAGGLRINLAPPDCV